MLLRQDQLNTQQLSKGKTVAFSGKGVGCQPQCPLSLSVSPSGIPTEGSPARLLVLAPLQAKVDLQSLARIFYFFLGVCYWLLSERRYLATFGLIQGVSSYVLKVEEQL